MNSETTTGWADGGAAPAAAGETPEPFFEVRAPPLPRRFPFALLIIAVPLAVMMLGLLAGASSYIWDSYRGFERLQTVDLPLKAAAGDIAHRSEVARLAVLAAVDSGDSAWRERYERSAARLDEALARARDLMPETVHREAGERVATSERALRRIEERVFGLLRAGRRAEAAALVAGSAYTAGRAAQEAAVAALAARLERRAQATLATQLSEATNDTAVVIGGLAVLLVAWIVVLRMLANSMREAAATAAALRRERDFAESLVENAQVIVLLLDTDGRIVRFNPYFAELSGYRLSQLRGRRWTDVFVPGGGARRGAPGRDQDRHERRGEVFPLLTRDGRERDILWYDKMLRDDGGNALGLLAVGLDTTERNQAEAQRLAREAADRANLAKSKFLAAASHDLRQPLQAMRMFVAALARRTGDRESGEIIGLIDESLDATNGLLNALLDISKLDAGVLTPELSDFAVGDLLERLAASFRPQAAEKRLELRLVPTAAVVRSDPALLESMLRNLVANAVRYTDRGRVLIGCRRRGAALSIEVWDTGIGIPEDQRDTIFEEFHQLGNPERERTRGLGLGLAIVERMSRLLGHDVTIRSTLGAGSVFAVEVPRATTAGRVAAAVSPGADLHGRLVMVIDDEATQLKGLRMALEGWGCRVLAARDAGEAIDLLDPGDPPDLVVADFRLAGNETGTRAIEAIRERMGRPVPGLILTGDTEPARLREARRSGYRIMHKPVEPAKLRDAMGEILGAGNDETAETAES